MNRRLFPALKYIGAGLVIAFGLFLIVHNILSGGGLAKIEALLPARGKSATNAIKPLAALPDFPKPPGKVPDEVRNYVLFTLVPFGGRDVVTGSEYSSTASRKITKQWCYFNGKTRPGGVAFRLDLASVSKTGKKTITQFTPEALAPFNLSAMAARGLVKTHCRFQ